MQLQSFIYQAMFCSLFFYMGMRIDRVKGNNDKKLLYGFLIYSILVAQFIYIVKDLILGDHRSSKFLYEGMAISGVFIIILIGLSLFFSRKYYHKGYFHWGLLPSIGIHVLTFIELGLLVCWPALIIFFIFEAIWNLSRITRNKPVEETVEKEAEELQSVKEESGEDSGKTKFFFLNLTRVMSLVFLGGILYVVFFSDNYLSSLESPSGKHEVYSGRTMELSDGVLNGTVITKQHIAYEKNRPKNSDVSNYIRWNSDVAYYEDRRLMELHNPCSNCMGYDRLITPRRVGYLKPGARLKVLNKFYYRGEDMFTILVPNNRSYHYIVEDIDTSLIYEVRDFDFDDIIKGEPYSRGRKDYYESVLKDISNIKDGEWSEIEYCFSSTYYTEEGISNFIEDFKIANEIKYDLSSKRSSRRHNVCLNMSFKSVEAYMTFRYYYEEWGGSSPKFRKLKVDAKKKGISPRLLKNQIIPMKKKK